MKTNKLILLLIGPKGSGKSFVGSLIQAHTGHQFVLVEEWVKNLREERDVDDETYVGDVFQIIESRIRQILETADSIVFESTGLSVHFDQMLSNLKSDFRLITIGIKADLALCSARIQMRDQTTHIKISDEDIIQINEAVLSKNISTDFEITNAHKTASQLLIELDEIMISI